MSGILFGGSGSGGGATGNTYWTISLRVNNAVLTSAGATSLWSAMPQGGTFVNAFAVAQGAVDDTGTVKIHFGGANGGVISIATLSAGVSKSATVNGSFGAIAANTAVEVISSGFASTGELNLQLVFATAIS